MCCNRDRSLVYGLSIQFVGVWNGAVLDGSQYVLLLECLYDTGYFLRVRTKAVSEYFDNDLQTLVCPLGDLVWGFECLLQSPEIVLIEWVAMLTFPCLLWSPIVLGDWLSKQNCCSILLCLGLWGDSRRDKAAYEFPLFEGMTQLALRVS